MSVNGMGHSQTVSNQASYGPSIVRWRFYCIMKYREHAAGGEKRKTLSFGTGSADTIVSDVQVVFEVYPQVLGDRIRGCNHD